MTRFTLYQEQDLKFLKSERHWKRAEPANNASCTAAHYSGFVEVGGRVLSNEGS